VTSEQVLVLAWLLLAHLVGDFVLQNEDMVADKFTTGRRRWRGLIGHGAGIGLALTPVALVYGDRGAAFLVVVTVGHVLIDRWKVRATRHAEAIALAGAHRRHAPAGSETGLGPAWTPVPAALFIVDQLAHVTVTVAAWFVLLARAGPTPEYVSLVDRALGGADRSQVHAAALIGVVVAAIVLVNVRAAALFVGTLVSPRRSVTGGRPAEPPPPDPRPPTAWRLRLGPFEATAEPAPGGAGTGGPSAVMGGPSGAASDRSAHEGHASPARIGATIGVLERLLIVVFVVTGSTAAIGFVVAAKTLARFKQLDYRDFAEYYLLGTLASVSVALVTGLLAAAALGTLP
jgi:hypothetical protein